MFSLSNFWEFDAPLMNQKPGKANFRELVSKKIPGGACPRAPLEACSLGPSFRKSVSIYPRSAPASDRMNAIAVRKTHSMCLSNSLLHVRAATPMHILRNPLPLNVVDNPPHNYSRVGLSVNPRKIKAL